MTKTFPEVISGIRTAKKGVEVREDIAQMGEYVEQFAATATQKAEAAAASEKKASDAVTNIDQQKADSVAAVQQAQATATTAITQTKDAALTDIGNAKTGALQEVANSTATATAAASAAASFASDANASKEASASSASAAANSASAASTSETNSSASASDAQKSAEEAAASADLAGTRANTDKTLSVENAPADAKAVGDIILDRTKETPQPIFYSKAEVEAKIKEILAAQREEDLARIKFWASNDPTSPASFIGGTWERIEDCTIWAASDTHPAGTKLEAGLPNIAAQVNDMLFSSSEPYITSDVFKPLFNGFINGYVSESGSSGVYRSNVQLKASLGNSIYGNSTTVQPPAYCTYIWRRVA